MSALRRDVIVSLHENQECVLTDSFLRVVSRLVCGGWGVGGEGRGSDNIFI